MKKRKRGGVKVRDNSTTSSTAIEWLLAPAITPAVFFKTHWERSPLFLQLSQTNPTRYDCLAATTSGAVCSGRIQPLFGTARLLAIAEEHGPLELGRELQLMRIGKHGVREAVTPPDSGLASSSWIQSRLDEGFTVQLFQPQHWCDRLWALLAAMEAEVGALCGCSVYHTPPACQGLAAHHDDVEVFILQTEGRKRWKLFSPLSGHDLPSEASSDLADEVELTL